MAVQTQVFQTQADNTFWTRSELSLSDFAAETTNSETLEIFPGRPNVAPVGLAIDVTTAFTGGSLTSAQLSLAKADGTELSTKADATATGKTLQEVLANTSLAFDTQVAMNVKLEAAGDTLDNLTAGALVIWVLYRGIPQPSTA